MNDAKRSDLALDMKARRVMILSDGFPPHDRGGAERIAYYHATALRDLGWEVAVFSSYPPGHEKSVEDEEPGIRVYRAFPVNPAPPHGHAGPMDRLLLLGSSLTNPFMRKPLEEAIDDFKPDLLHAHYIVRISHSVFARVAPELPRIITFHGYQYECPKGGLYRKRRAEICQDKPIPCRIFRDRITHEFASVDRILAISRFIEARLIDAGYPAEKIRYVPNGVPNLESREPTKASKNRVFLYVGRITHNKGVVELIQAFKQLDAQGARLVIVGDGEYRETCEAAAAGDSRIEFVGWQSPDQVAAHYRAARVVVVPSLWHEVMNTVICEAESWSRPVLATLVGGNTDLIRHDESGLMCPPGDVEALRHHMQHLWDDDDAVDRLGAGGFSHVGQYSMQRHLEGVLRIYAEQGLIGC